MSRLWAFAGICVLVLAVWLTGYQSRTEIVASQRAGCQRGRLDREANARAWREAEKARLRSRDFDVARIYASVAAGLEARARIDCGREFRRPPLLKF